MSPLRWTTKLTRNLAAELTRQGHRVGADTVGAADPHAAIKSAKLQDHPSG